MPAYSDKDKLAAIKAILSRQKTQKDVQAEWPGLQLYNLQAWAGQYLFARFCGKWEELQAILGEEKDGSVAPAATGVKGGRGVRHSKRIAPAKPHGEEGKEESEKEREKRIILEALERLNKL